MTPAALARYRLRPVPWGWLAVLVTGWLLGTRLLVELPIDPGMGITVVRWTALLLGLGGAVLAAPETDPPQDLLRAGPVPHWRTLALRLAGWLALGAAPILALAALLDVLAAARTSILDGGAAAMATTVGLTTAGRAWPAWFPIQLTSVPGDPRWHSSRVWMVGLSLALAASALLAERRTGLALRRRRRRPTSRPSPASEARVRP